MSAPRDHTVDAQGLTIHYLEWGDPNGEPLVLVPISLIAGNR
jgi:hypothetical protein